MVGLRRGVFSKRMRFFLVDGLAESDSLVQVVLKEKDIESINKPSSPLESESHVHIEEIEGSVIQIEQGEIESIDETVNPFVVDIKGYGSFVINSDHHSNATYYELGTDSQDDFQVSDNACDGGKIMTKVEPFQWTDVEVKSEVKIEFEDAVSPEDSYQMIEKSWENKRPGVQTVHLKECYVRLERLSEGVVRRYKKRCRRRIDELKKAQ